MTRERLKNCFSIRKELALTGRRLESCKENSHQAQRLKEKAAELQAEYDAVENFVDSLESSLMRQIVTLRFIEGMKFKDICAFVGYSDATVKRKVKSLFPD